MLSSVARSTTQVGKLTWDYYPASTLPAPYDIVWCRFPFLPSVQPGLYPRPGLVRNVAPFDDGTCDVEVVYGTTKLKFHQRRDDFFITKASEMAACGLDRATRFDLDNILWLPWSSEWFEPLGGANSPVIGTLTDHAVKMLQLTVSMRQHKVEHRRTTEQPQLSLDPPKDDKE